MSVVLDTNALLGIINKRDQHHRIAKMYLDDFKRRNYHLILPRICLIEAIGQITRDNNPVLSAALQRDHRLRLLDKITNLGMTVLEHDPIDYDEAERWWRRYADRPLDFPDLLIAASSRRSMARRLLTFDNDFNRFLATEVSDIAIVHKPFVN